MRIKADLERSGTKARTGLRWIPGLLPAALLLALAPGLAQADPPPSEGPFAFESFEKRYGGIPAQFQYLQGPRSHESMPPSVSFRRNQERSVEAPTRYRIKSILRYETAIGNTGMQFRVRLPLKLKKIVKLELRF